MKQINLILLLFTLTVNNLSAQVDIDKENFERIFEKTTTERSPIEDQFLLYRYVAPQAIPGWFSNIPATAGDSIYVIGISDPGTDSTAAIEQALFRALSIASILNKSANQLLNDYFITEANNSNKNRYESFFRITTTMPVSPDYEIIKKFRNEFDETMVLIRLTPDGQVKSNNPYLIRADVYKSEILSGSVNVFETVYDISVTQNDKEIMYYRLMEYGSLTDVVSYSGNNRQQVPAWYLHYLTSYGAGDYVSLTHGLWKDYLKALIMELLKKAREKDEHVKYVSELYRSTDIDKITRGTAINKTRIELTGITLDSCGVKVETGEL